MTPEGLLRGMAEEVVETHISRVFLGRELAWKVKKPVDLGFLDFTTLRERERLVRHEFALNAPHAPGLYRRVVAVTRTPGGSLALDGAGEPVEWVLEMRRLPHGAFLDVAPLPDPRALGDAVAALHASAPLRDGDGSLAGIIAQNRDSALAAGLPEGRVLAWADAAAALHGALAPLLAARARAGMLRRCHGDLHLGNLCILDGAVRPFDALEFDEAMATVDVGYDLAFLLMDLELRHGRASANAVMNRWVARTGDAGMVAGLPLWLSLRAMIRAHVECRRGREWAALLRFAEEALRPVPPRLVAVGGLQGTGKSHLARRLAPLLGRAPGALHLRSDEIRKRLRGVPPEERLPAEAYTPDATAAVFAELTAMARAAFNAGHAVVADAVFGRAAERAALAPCEGLWLSAPLEVLRARVAARRGDASDAGVEVLEATAARGIAAPEWVALDASADPLASACKALDLDAPAPP